MLTSSISVPCLGLAIPKHRDLKMLGLTAEANCAESTEQKLRLSAKGAAHVLPLELQELSGVAFPDWIENASKRKKTDKKEMKRG